MMAGAETSVFAPAAFSPGTANSTKATIVKMENAEEMASCLLMTMWCGIFEKGWDTLQIGEAVHIAMQHW